MLLKYGESTSDDETEPESGTEPDSDEDDCAVTSPPPKKQKAKSPPQDKDKAKAQDPETSSQPNSKPGAQPKSFVGFGDPITPLLDAVANLRLDMESKNQVLIEVANVIGVRPDRNLAAKVAECIADPSEAKRHQAEVQALRGELEKTKADLFRAREDIVAIRMIAREVSMVAT